MRSGDKVIIFITIANLVVVLALSVNKLTPGGLKNYLNKDTQIENPFKTSKLKNPFAAGEIKHFDLVYKPAGLNKLEKKRQDALKTGFLFASSSDYVKGRLHYQGKNFRIATRLKGDLVEHLEGNKWSFRVKVLGNNTINGMKVFSLHNPRQREYIKEWIYHRMMAEEGIISLRYEFVTVSVNGVYLGIFAMEEHFDKRLVEHNRRREGPILKFDETNLWLAHLKYKNGIGVNDTKIYEDAEISSFKSKSLRENEQQYKYFLKAKQLIDKFRKGELTTSQVFDVDLLAPYCAISEMLGAGHGKRWHNIRFYYNPVTSLIEPVPFDACPGSGLEAWNKGKGIFYTFHYDALNRRFYSDPQFFKKFTQAIQRIASKEYLDRFFERNDDEIDRQMALLNKEFSDLKFSRQRSVYENQAYVKSVFRKYSDVFCFYGVNGDNAVSIVCENKGRFPIEMLAVAINGRTHTLSKPIELRTKDFKYYNMGRTTIVPSTRVTPGKTNITVVHGILGATQKLRTTVHPDQGKVNSGTGGIQLQKPRIKRPRKNSIVEENANVFEFNCLAVDDAKKTIHFTNDICSIKSDLIIPSGYTVVCEGGKQIQLYNNASVISYSAFKFEGTPNQPIRILSPDGTGNGIAILKAPELSTFRYVVFENLDTPQSSNWLLTGAVTLYESDVIFESCRFSNNRCEDALNTIRNQFTIKDSVFFNTYGDSFDSDFCTGTIENTNFEQCGNDCIDVSGSEVTVDSVKVDVCGDKGISAGENSKVQAKRVKIDKCNVGLAGKDLSVISADTVSISDTKIGLCGYQKKPEFGQSKIDTRSTTMNNVDLPWILEQGSEIFVNGKKVPHLGKSKQKQIFKRLKNGQNLY